MNETKNSTLDVIKRVFRHLSSRRRHQLIILGILMIISSFVEAISISSIIPFLAALTDPTKLLNIPFLKGILEYTASTNPSDMRLVFTVTFIGLILASGFFRITFFWLQTRLSMAIGIDFSVQVYEKTLFQPYEEIISRNSSEILAGAHKAKDLVGYIIQPALIFFSSLFMLVVVLTTLFIIEPTVAISGVIGFGTLYFIATAVSKRFLLSNSRVYAAELGRVNKVIQEGVGGIRDVIIDANQPTYAKVYRRALTRMQLAAAGNVLLAQTPRFVIEMLGLVFMATITYVLVSRDGDFVAAIPIFGAIALGAQRLLPILQQTYSAYATIRGGMQSTIDALNLLDQAEPTTTDDTNQSHKLKFNSTLTLNKVHYAYQSSARPVLNNINLHISRGDRIGLIGATGSGKSTLVDLIMGLLTPSDGNILIDGEELNEKNMRAWHALVAHVPQSVYLADTTIAANIAFGIEKHEIDMIRVKEAARIAQVSDVVESLPQKYQTFVGERGIKLSGGQRQRIGLARALYKKARVLVLDEATSALDNETEENVMSAIEGLGKDITMIHIAHRLTTLKNCDYIIELKKGKVFWEGKFSEISEH